MATIHIGYSLFADTEEEAKKIGIPQLKTLWVKVRKALELVEEDCLMRFPDLLFEVLNFDPDLVCLDETDEKDGKILWDLTYWIEVETLSPDGIPECDYSFDAYDQWRKIGQPMYKDVCEPLYDCDWSSFESMCGATDETMGETVSVEFQSIQAVDSYHGGIHFYNNDRWL